MKGQEKKVRYGRLNISVVGENDSLINASLLLWDAYLLNKGNDNFNVADYWSATERKLFSDEWVDGRYRYLDYSRKYKASLFYKPLILSVKREVGNRILIKTLFYHFWPDTDKLVVTKIIDVYAVIEDGRLLLQSPLYAHIKQAFHKKVGNINYYIVNDRHKFNVDKANYFDSTNTSLANLFGTTPLEVNYVLGDSTDAVMHTLGYSFDESSMYQNFQKSGLAEPLNRLILSGNGDEIFTHELVHLYIYKLYLSNPTNRTFHNYANEGVATFFGGSLGMTARQLLHQLYKKDKKTPIDFSNCLSITDNFDGFDGPYLLDYSYLLGALFCEIAYERGGMQSIHKLLSGGPSDDEFYITLESVIGVKRENMNQFIHEQLKKYAE